MRNMSDAACVDDLTPLVREEKEVVRGREPKPQTSSCCRTHEPQDQPDNGMMRF